MKVKKAFAIGMVAALAMGLVACGGTKITELSIDDVDLDLGTGETYQIDIAYKAKNEADLTKINEAAKNYVLEWASSNELVATVDENGLVTAVDAGDAVITVSVKDHDKLTATCNVKVENKVRGVSVETTMDLAVKGDPKNVKATITPKKAENYEIRYESSDEKIATVDKDGNVTPVAEGECIIKTIVVAKENADADETERASSSEVVSEAAASQMAASDASSEVVVSDVTNAQDKKATDEVILATAETRVTVTPEDGLDLSKPVTNSDNKTTKDNKNANKSTANGTNTTPNTTTPNATAVPASNTNTGSSNGNSSGGSSSSSGGSSSGSSNKGSSSSGGSSSGGSTQTPAPSNPTPAPAPVQPDPTPAPAPAQPDPTPVQPDPAPAPDPEPDPAPVPDPDPEPEQTPPPASDRKDANEIVSGDRDFGENGGDAELAPD